jgi:hypothetical protein
MLGVLQGRDAEPLASDADIVCDGKACQQQAG